jgi:hypothetical protein
LEYIMSYFGSADYYVDVALGKVPGAEIVRKFGDGIVGTTYVPVAGALVYQTPIAAASLEIVSNNANDTGAGTGAQTVTIVGLTASWVEVSQTVTMNGVTAVAIPTPLIRMYRIVVATSGTYATATAPSHAGLITVRAAGAGATWGIIDTATGFNSGQSNIACYTVPAGKTAYLIWKNIEAESGKTVDCRFFQRPFADDVVTPFTGVLKQVEREANAVGDSQHLPKAPIGPFVGPCDLGFMAKVTAGTAIVNCEFQLLMTTP